MMDGILLVDKPTDWTSHDVCAFVKRRHKIDKVGHAGTLDPMATGLLVLLLGQGTKFSMQMSASDKDYEGTFQLGVKTDSHDRQGKVLATAPWETISLEQIEVESKKFVGEILQTPPMVSALKQKGVRLYQLARKGLEVPREARKVSVYSFKFFSKDGAFVKFSASVSKGTYVRTLVNDLGDALGCHGSLSDLRRTRSGVFKIEQSVTVDQIKQMTNEEFRAKLLPLSGYADSHKS